MEANQRSENKISFFSWSVKFLLAKINVSWVILPVLLINPPAIGNGG